MEIIDLLQCDSCKKILEDFKALDRNLSKSDIELLEAYTVFAEMRRLKEATIKKPLGSGIRYTPAEMPLYAPSDLNGLAVTC